MKLFSGSRRLWVLVAAAWLSIGAHDCILGGLWITEADAAHHHAAATSTHHPDSGGEPKSIEAADCDTVAVKPPATSPIAPVLAGVLHTRAVPLLDAGPALPAGRPAPERPPRFLLHAALLI
jgi:hypothetical protein